VYANIGIPQDPVSRLAPGVVFGADGGVILPASCQSTLESIFNRSDPVIEDRAYPAGIEAVEGPVQGRVSLQTFLLAFRLDRLTCC
jgi:hypothetical protein